MHGGAKLALIAAGLRVAACVMLLVAAPAPLAAQRLPIKTYTAADGGLPHNNVKRIVRDSRGFLWFCTGGGLSRFDGYRFTNFGPDDGLPGPTVNDLLETKQGQYWVATDGGLTRFDPTGTPLFSGAITLGADPRSKPITVLRESRDGTIWVGTTNGLYRLDQTISGFALRPVELQFPGDDPWLRAIADIVEDRRGSLWVASGAALHRRWPDGRTAHYPAKEWLSDESHFTDLLEDRSGGLWIATRYHGFLRFRVDEASPPSVDALFHYNEKILPTGWVPQVFETMGGGFWAGTTNGLVELLPAEDNGRRRFRSYNEWNGLSYSDVQTISEDLDGNLWLGTSHMGAMKLARGGFTSFGPQNGVANIRGVFEDGLGNVCFRGWLPGDSRTTFLEGGKISLLERPTLHQRIGCFDGKRFDAFKPAAIDDFGWESRDVTLRTRGGEWWIGTGEGVYRFAPTDGLNQLRYSRALAVYSTADGLGSPQIIRLFEDSRGDVWISTNAVTKRVALWDRRSRRVKDLSSFPGLASVSEGFVATAFAEDAHGNVWIGFSGELVRYSNGSFKLFTSRDGVPAGAISGIHRDQKKRLWLVSTRTGLTRVDREGTDQPAFVPAQGLSTSNIEAVAEDAEGLLYLAGGRGLESFDPATGHVRHFSTADGLPEGTVVAAFGDRHGVMWFGTTTGIAALAPERGSARVAPTVWIDGLRVRGVAQRVSVLGQRHVSVPALTLSQNQLDIDFVGLSFSSGERLRYQYRLDGADTDWSTPNHQRSVRYASLSPGRYTFHVRAVSSDGIESVEPATVAFDILRPVWQRVWFLSLAAIAVGSVMYALYRYRISRLVEIANMRMHIATDLHDDIGANLTKIALLSEVAQRDAPGDTALTSIARLARESSGSMNDIVWAINPKRETLLDLIRRMRQHAADLFTQRGIHMEFNPQVGMDDVKLGMAIRRDLLLIFKEAVNNAARHSRCSAVRIDLSIDGSRLLLKIADDGCGFDPPSQNDGQGLASIQRRAQRLNGRIVVTSAPGAGATVTVDVPL